MIKYISIRDNHIIEYVHHNEIEILHIAGKLNVSEIFTKELHDRSHFRALRNAFMRPIL